MKKGLSLLIAAALCQAKAGATVGVIGGADGPTTIFVAGNLGGWAAGAAAVIAVIVALVWRRRRKNRA